MGIYDNGQVPDQFESKDSPLLRVPMYTQQGERRDDVAMSQEYMQRELSHMQDQITVMQHQLQNQNQNQQVQYPISPTLPGSPMYPHVVPREYTRLQNQQVPLSPQHPQINFGGSHGGSSSSLHRNVVNRQFLAPPQFSHPRLSPPRQQQPQQQSQQQLQQQQQQQQQPQQLQQQQQHLQQQHQLQLQQHFNQQQLAHQQLLHQQPHHTSFGEQVVRKDAMMSYLMDSLNVVKCSSPHTSR